MCVRHDHIEAILHEEDRQREQDVVSEKPAYIYSVHHFTSQETHNPQVYDRCLCQIVYEPVHIVECLVPGSS